MTDAGPPGPPGASQNVDAELASLRERYASASDNTVAAFELLAARLKETATTPQLLSTLRRELHRVQGTAASLGFGEAGRIAGAMETLTTRWMDDSGLDRERRGIVVGRFARSLREALAPQDTRERDDDGPASRPRRLMLIDLPDEVASGLIAEGVVRGYRVERVGAEDVGAALAREEPTVIVSSARALRADQAPGLPRVLLHTGDGDDQQVPAAPGQRVLDIRTDAGQMLDVLELLEHLGGPAAGKVVIVDDDPVVRALLRSLVARDGLAVETFANARSCLTGLETTDPLILVLDVDLAKTSGVALAQKVRLVPAWADVPILMVTSHADATTRAAAFAAGADDYMVKPIVPAEFQQRLTRLVEARRRGRLAGGVHPATGLPLRARTLREVEARLRDMSEGSASVVIVRPAVVPKDARAEDAWRLEVVRVARAMRTADGIAGFVDELGLGGMLPLRAPDVRRRLASLVEDAPVNAPAWHAGIASHDAGAAAPRTGALWDEAEAACLGARDRAAPARVWNASDFDVAPDVVVIETDDALADLIVFALDARGLTQRRFATGPAALDALLLMRPHGRTPIVLLEVDLPGLNGHSLHERLRLDRPGIFDVVFLSTHASEAEQLRALQDGALDYITKPVSLRVLVAKLASWRSRHLSA